MIVRHSHIHTHGHDNMPHSTTTYPTATSALDEIFQYILNLFTNSRSVINTSTTTTSHHNTANDIYDVNNNINNNAIISGENLAEELLLLHNKSPKVVEFFIPQLAVFLLYGKCIKVGVMILMIRLCNSFNI